MNIFTHIDNLEKLHQALKREYLNWASKKKDKGIGTKNNPLTLKFINRYLSPSLKKEILQELKIISNFLKTNNNLTENYQILREIYIISPSFHEMWFFSTHFATNLKSIIKGRLGLKAFLTSKKKGILNKTFKGITSFVTKRFILLENLFPQKESVIKSQPSKNVERDINLLLNRDEKFDSPEEINEVLPILYRITHYFLKKTKYSLLKSEILLGKNSWLKYAPCAINEGPIFIKKSNQKRIEIFNQIPSWEEKEIRVFLSKNFEIEEVLK
jgi:hypothetical protein